MAFDWGWVSSALKITGWRAAAVAVGCAILFILRPFPIPEKWIWVIGAVGIVSACIAAVGVLEAIWSGACSFDAEAVTRWHGWRYRRHVLRQLDTLSGTEKEIFGRLLTTNERSFVSSDDGGRANTLLAKNLIGRPTQLADSENCVFLVPEFVWKKLQKRRSEFPDTADPLIEPWRIDWRER